MIIKSISIREPFASMIRDGKKTIETRTWKTNYKGNLLICASKYPKTEFSGKAIAIAELYNCRKMEKGDERDACCKIYEKAYSLCLRNIRPIPPFHVKGKLSLFNTEINDDIEKYI